MEPVRIFSTRPNRYISKITSVDGPVDRFLTDPVDRFFTKGFCSLFNTSNEKFSKGGMLGEVLKFVTPDGGLRKKKQNFFEDLI